MIMKYNYIYILIDIEKDRYGSMIIGNWISYQFPINSLSYFENNWNIQDDFVASEGEEEEEEED